MMKNNYAVVTKPNAKKAKSTFDNEEQRCGSEDNKCQKSTVYS